MTHLAVDGDILAYRVAAVCEEDFAKACNSIIDDMLTDIATHTGIADMRIYLSGENNYRYDVAVTTPYKAGRKTKPQHLQYCRDYLCRIYGATVINGYEADDAIASDMVKNGAFHCGIDKDIYQIPGKHYNFVTKEWREVTPDEATINLYRQILTGDKTDNIPGLPLIGDKKAAKAINNANTANEDAKQMYREVCEKKLPEVNVAEYWKEQVLLVQMIDDLDVTGDCVRIKRRSLNI